MHCAGSRSIARHAAAQWYAAGLFHVAAMCVLMLLGLDPVHAQQNGVLILDSLLVDEIVFEEDSASDRETLLGQISTRESPGSFARWLYSAFGSRFPFSGEPEYFDIGAFKDDVDALKRHFKNTGYISAAVEGVYEILESKRDVRAVFRIKKGQRSYIDSVDYRNLQRLPQRIDSLIRHSSDRLLVVGQPYDADATQAEVNRVLRLLGNNGFPVAVSDSILVERKLSNKNVTVHLWFTCGTQLVVGDIQKSISNEEELNLAQQIIDDRIELESGEVWSNEQRERSEVNLNRLNIFSNAQLVATFPALADSAHRFVPVTVLLSMKPRHELAPAVLVNTQFNRFNAGAEVAYLFRNAFGGAQTITTKLNVLSKVDLPVNSYQASAQVQLDQPYFLDNKTSGVLTISYILAQESGLYGGSIVQGVVELKRLFTERLQGFVAWTLEQSQYNIIASGQSLVNTPFAQFDTTGIDYRNSIVAVTLDRDYTNDFFYPSSGLSLRGTVEEAGILKALIPGAFRGFQSTEYRKTEGTVRWFTDLSRHRSSIFGVKLKAGTIFRYGESLRGDIPVPFNRRYYAGGSQSVRAWSASTLAAAGQEEAAFGGNALVEASMELRWQMFPGAKKWLAVEPENLWLVLFADVGNLWREASVIRLNEAAIGFGVGIRYNLFFGPIRVDYALKGFDPSDAQDPWFTQRHFWSDVFFKGQLVLGIGHAF